MARIRTIKPEFWDDEDLSELCSETSLLAIGLLNFSDDEGYFNANPKLIESKVFPLRELSSTCTVLILNLSKCGYISLYSGSDGKKYGLINNFTRHQVINKPKPSKIKDLVDVPYEDGTDTEPLPQGKEGKGKEGKGRDKSEARFKKPMIEEIADYCQSRNNGIDAETFFHNYETKGWKVNGSPMKNWKSAVITWEKRDSKSPTKPQAQGNVATAVRWANS